MSPFAPKGEVAQWRIVHDLFQQAETGDTLTYAEISEALDLHPAADLHRIQAAARKAAKHLLQEQDRAVETVPRTGYRLVPAIRQIPLAGQQVERAEKALIRGKDLTTHIRMEELSEKERSVVHAMALGFAQVAEWARQIGRRVEDHEDRLADVEAELKRLREQQEPPTSPS